MHSYLRCRAAAAGGWPCHTLISVYWLHLLAPILIPTRRTSAGIFEFPGLSHLLASINEMYTGQATTTKKLRSLRKLWLFDSLSRWKDACDVGVEFERSVEPWMEEFEDLNNLDNLTNRQRLQKTTNFGSVWIEQEAYDREGLRWAHNLLGARFRKRGNESFERIRQ